MRDFKGPCEHSDTDANGVSSSSHDWNDTISSLRIAPGWRARLYRGAGYRDEALEVAADVRNLQWWLRRSGNRRLTRNAERRGELRQEAGDCPHDWHPVDKRKKGDDLLESIGHELHHVTEVLADRGMLDPRSIRVIYQRLAATSLYRYNFETDSG